MIDLGTKKLETERLILRKFKLSDSEDIYISEDLASGRVMQKSDVKYEAILRDRKINKYTNKICLY